VAIRQLRHYRGATTTMPWIVSTASLGNNNTVAAVDANYAGEENTVQGGADLKALGSIGAVTAAHLMNR
jgi:hypothetical protein